MKAVVKFIDYNQNSSFFVGVTITVHFYLM
jgi:hypothetical protein